MAILDGDTVLFRRGHPLLAPAPPLRGIATGVVAGVSADVNWTSGFQALTIPAADLEKAIASPAGLDAFVTSGLAYRWARNPAIAQECMGVAHVFVTENDAATFQMAWVVLELIGNPARPPSYLTLQSAQIAAPATAAQLMAALGPELVVLPAVSSTDRRY